MSAPPGWPNTADHPQQLGPFRVLGRRHAEASGAVLAGVAPDGRPVDLVVLGAGPGSDAATRDRFGAGVASLAADRPGAVVAADPRPPWPWVALVPGTPGTALLAAAVPAATVAAERGPQFAPHWYGSSPVPVPVADPAPAPAPVEPAAVSRRWWWVAGAVVALLLLLLLLWLLDPPGGGGGDGSPQPQPTRSEPAPDRSPEPGPGGSASPDPEKGTTLDLAGLAFDVTLPASWGCVRSELGPPDAVRWVCIDEAWDIQDGPPPTGVVQQQPCPQPCGPQEWTALQEQNALGATLTPLDGRTATAEDVDPVTGTHLRLQLSRLFAAQSSGPVDTHVHVRLAVPQDGRDDALRILNGVVAATP